MSAFCAVMDQAGHRLGIMDNAGDVGYSLPRNDLWTASFTLPADDPNNQYCTAHNLVYLPDDNRDIGLQRIIAIPGAAILSPTTNERVYQYSTEHVMATLLDDVLFGYHEIGGSGMPTPQVMEYILARQTVKRWVLGVCDFTDEYAYKFENDALLPALLSLGNYIADEYDFEFDTSTTPYWTVNLRRSDTADGCGMHYLRNLCGINKTMDASTLVTRLYMLGYGEGVNQLTIKDVNGGIPYIDADTQDTWGIKCAVYADTSIEDPTALKAFGDVLLEKLKDPYFSISATAIDLAAQTGFSWDRFMPGKLVRVTDGEHGSTYSARIVLVDKPNVRGRSGEVDITIANAARDAAESLTSLASRLSISELYSQGATNLYSQQYADNADAAHPAVMRVYIPSGCVRINQMLLYWQLAKFRAYETGAAAGGASVQTSSSSGGGTKTSAAGGGYYDNAEAWTGGPLDMGGLSSKTETDAGGDDVETAAANGYTGSRAPRTGSASSSYTNAVDGSAGYHYHYMGHTHAVDSHTHSLGSHTHLGGRHTHGMNHWHFVSIGIEIPSHTHTITLSSHTHSVSIGTHVHEMLFGIYEGGQAGSVTISVDGNAVPAENISGGEIDVAAYLDKDDAGKITRGAWHEISITPDALTRIEVNLFVQTFVQSRGGGDY